MCGKARWRCANKRLIMLSGWQARSNRGHQRGGEVRALARVMQVKICGRRLRNEPYPRLCRGCAISLWRKIDTCINECANEGKLHRLTGALVNTPGRRSMGSISGLGGGRRACQALTISE